MWTTLDEQRLHLARGRGRDVGTQLRRLGLLPPQRPATGPAVAGALQRLTRYAAESSVLQNLRSGNTYPVFRSPGPGRCFDIITRPEGESLGVLAIQEAPEYAAPPPDIFGDAVVHWGDPVDLRTAHDLLRSDPNAVYLLEQRRRGRPYYVGKTADDDRPRTLAHAADIRRHSRAHGVTPRQAERRVQVRIGRILPTNAATPLTRDHLERIFIRKGNKVLRGGLTNDQNLGRIRVPPNQAIVIQHTGAVPDALRDRRTRDGSRLVIRGGRQGRAYELSDPRALPHAPSAKVKARTLS
jgi:hypothetical protein